MKSGPEPDPDDGWDSEAPDPVAPPDLEVDVTEPTILAELYGPNGDVIAYLVDRRPIPFGYTRGE